jgi:O-antigen/teichoic acid export membrane protein
LGFGYGLVTLALGAAPLTVALFKLIETLGSLAGGVAAVAGLGFAPWRRPSFRRLPATLRQGLVFALLEVTAITYNKANLFFLQQAGGPVAVGQYSVTWQVVDGFSTLVTGLLLQSVMFPLFVQLWEADRTEVSRLAQEAARWLLAAAVPLMFVLFIESDRLILLIFGPQYREAVWLQKYLVATIAIAFLHNLAAFLLLTMNLARLLLFFYLGGLIFNLAWCALVIPLTPLLGAALAMVLTLGGVAVATVSACQRRLNLLPGRALGQLGAAALGGLLLYLLATSHLPRLAGEALALTPLAALAWHWWRRGRKK